MLTRYHNHQKVMTSHYTRPPTLGYTITVKPHFLGVFTLSDRISRSVAFTVEVDNTLADLAAAEGTSRADLIRQALTMLLHDRGINLDATAGITTDRVAVTHQRNRRHAPPGGAVCDAWRDWWATHRDQISGHDLELLDAVAEHITGNIDRAGRVMLQPVDALVPDGYAGDYATASKIDQIVHHIVMLGGAKHERRRGGRRWLQPAPWVLTSEP